MTTENNSGSTLHQRILSDIEGRILSGQWPPGHHLPFEVDLAAQYGCSRMTVNKVMTQLAKSGLVERRKKSGTFVAQPRSQSAVLEIRDIREEVEALNLAYRYTLVSRTLRKSTAADERRLGLSAGTRVLDLTCVHHGGDRPFCLEQRLINLSVVSAAEVFDFSTLAPGPWLLAEVPWSRAEHRIGAIAAAADEAKYLDLATGHACLEVERQTWSGLGAVTHVYLRYPFEVHRLVAQFVPVSG